VYNIRLVNQQAIFAIQFPMQITWLKIFFLISAFYFTLFCLCQVSIYNVDISVASLHPHVYLYYRPTLLTIPVCLTTYRCDAMVICRLFFFANVPHTSMRVATGGGHWGASPPVAAGPPRWKFCRWDYMPQISHHCVVS